MNYQKKFKDDFQKSFQVEEVDKPISFLIKKSRMQTTSVQRFIRIVTPCLLSLCVIGFIFFFNSHHLTKDNASSPLNQGFENDMNAPGEIEEDHTTNEEIKELPAASNESSDQD